MTPDPILSEGELRQVATWDELDVYRESPFWFDVPGDDVPGEDTL